MARYDYRCSSCDITFEVEHPMTARPDIHCPRCGREARRVFSANGIKFEGSGFYNTDQRHTTTKSSKKTSSKAPKFER